MRDFYRFVKRRVHRAGVFALMILITAMLILEHISKLAGWFVRLLMRLAGVERIEPWLKARSVWFAIPTVALTGMFFFVFELGQYALFASGHYWLGLAAHFAKWLPLFVSNYFLRVYKDTLLEVGWILRLYQWYGRRKELLFAWLQMHTWYKRAVERIAKVKRRWRTFAARVRLWITAVQIRHSRLQTAKRLRSVRVRNGQCVGGS